MKFALVKSVSGRLTTTMHRTLGEAIDQLVADLGKMPCSISVNKPMVTESGDISGIGSRPDDWTLEQELAAQASYRERVAAAATAQADLQRG